MSERGKLLVISGPSGTGKSTVIGHLMKLRPGLEFSVSATTRAPRPGEVDGREYFFVTHERFAEMVDNNELLEHASFVGNHYGTPRSQVEKRLEQGITVILIEQKIMLLCEFAKQLAVLSEGRIFRQGDTREVLADAEELLALGVNCPRVTTLSRTLSARTGEEQPVCINLDEAENMVRRLIS